MLVDTTLVEPFNFAVGKRILFIGEIEHPTNTDSKVWISDSIEDLHNV